MAFGASMKDKAILAIGGMTLLYAASGFLWFRALTDKASDWNKSQRAYVDNFAIQYTGELRKKYESIYGDVNGDGVVTAVDVSCIVNVLAGLESADVYQGRANVNGDSAGVTAADIAAVVNILAGL
jgi:hypothetical protein